MVFPDALKMKQMIYGEDHPDDNMKTLAEQFVASERYHEALGIYSKLNDSDAILSLIQTAIQDGNLMLYTLCCHAMDKEQDTDQLQKIMSHAEKLGKHLYAEQINNILNPGSQEDAKKTE